MTRVAIPDLQDAAADTTVSTAYDSIWAQTTQAPVGLETVFLAEDKLYVVLVVVLIIWFGIIFFLYRTDRKIAQLERSLEQDIHETEGPA
ncbi:MAG: hypothetical protein KJO98_14455 [Rhodothermia bacterium]|nr:hypothetical protein [Rhodothermia bacterium]